MHIDDIAVADDTRIVELLGRAQNSPDDFQPSTMLSVLKRFMQVAKELDARRDAMSRIFEALGGPADVDAISKINELKTKCDNQRQRIVHLEGATNHVGGTPLTIAKDKLRAATNQINNLVVTVGSLERALDDERARGRGSFSHAIEQDAARREESDRCERFQDALRAAHQETETARAEVRQYKEYTNALHEIAKSFLPLCPEKAQSILNLAIGKGKELADYCRRKLIGERDNDWAEALQPLTGSFSLSPETAAARVGITIKETKVKLLKAIQQEAIAVGKDSLSSGWFRYQAEKLQRSLGDSLPWETRTSAVVPTVNPTKTASGSPVPPEESKGKWVVT